MVVQLLDRAIPAPRSIRRLAHKPRRFATPLGRRVGTQRDGYDFRRVAHQAFNAHERRIRLRFHAVTHWPSGASA